MKAKLLVALLLTVAAVKAQTSNVILFTEYGERFQVVVNGILQNANPEPNVKIIGLIAPSYKARIIFQDKTLGYLDFDLYLSQQGTESTYTIKKNKGGSYVVRFVSAVAADQAPPTPPSQAVVVYSTIPQPAESTTTIQQTTTTTTDGGGPNNYNMNINMDPNGGSINMNVPSGDGTMGTTSSTTTTTTTRSTTIVTNDPPPPLPAPAPQVVYVRGYNGVIGCPVPMSREDFESFRNTVSSKSFEDSKLTIAKQVLNNNCLTSSQVKETMGLFSFETTRLDFAKYAYSHTYDINNYYKVNDAFEFESSISELNNYITK